MLKKSNLLLLFLLVLLLSACNEDVDANEAQNENQDEESTHEEQEEETAELEVEEVQQIMEENVKEIHRIMSQIHDENYLEWTQQEWSMDIENEGEEFQAAFAIVRESLTELMTDNGLDQQVEHLLRSYFCGCDTYGVFMETDTQINIEIMDQSEDRFQATSMTLGSEALIHHGWTNEWHFKMEGENWKLDEYHRIDPDEEPLDLTFDDLQNAFRDYETGEIKEMELVDETEIGGERFIIIKNESGFHSAYNVKDGSINMSLGDTYNNPDEEGNNENEIEESNGTEEEQQEEMPVIEDPEDETEQNSEKESDQVTEEAEEAETQQNEEKESVQESPDTEEWSGTWYRNGEPFEGTMNISNVTDDSFDFDFDVRARDRTSFIEGTASVSGNEAEFYNEEFDCKLEMMLEGGQIEVVDTNGCTKIGGMGTFFSGTYETEQKVE
ncbi:flagellar biosynthesis GTPase FlhF [Virgibacillus natechei]|uniref:Flagellar biosynthesis GTPase FlhF n=1 Tax=Virgibacillus natechei TaxID=1216297 RepID=A0ABS4IK73_9BACI|nr:hypothetical protein [Virgibacillus natechei]MBP1971359.1 flagellar biosynthesis GTPase FlhF [Virgibacillus natechei]UZD12263.1 hypothetical protein OLD84_15220 [Virgibacillus natechei]